MSIVNFDTLEYVKELEKNGFTAQQAEALATSQKRAFEQALETQLATKRDTWEIKTEQKLHRWMIGFNLAFSMAILYKLFAD
jgi:hypothetical protein